MYISNSRLMQVPRQRGGGASPPPMAVAAPTQGFMDMFIPQAAQQLLPVPQSGSDAQGGSGSSSETGEYPPVPMNTNGSLVDRVAGYEGFSDKAYDDYGQYSIGYGLGKTWDSENNTWRNVRRGDTITPEQARADLERRLAEDRAAVAAYGRNKGYEWNDNQLDALTSFAYNTGMGNFRRLTGNGSRSNDQIANMMLRYNRAGGEVLPGLTSRRTAEQQWFLS